MDPVALSWELLVWAVQIQGAAGTAAEVRSGCHLPKYTGKRAKREDHINHCCWGEQLPELGLDSTAAFLQSVGQWW